MLKRLNKAPDNKIRTPVAWIRLIFSSKRMIPKIITNTGSKTDNIDACSELICFKPFNSKTIGNAVQIIPMPQIFNQTTGFLGTIKEWWISAPVRQIIVDPKETKKVDINGLSGLDFEEIMYKAYKNEDNNPKPIPFKLKLNWLPLIKQNIPINIIRSAK